MFKKFGKQILGSTFIVSGSSAATYKYVTKTHEEAENSRNIELENAKIIKQEIDSKKYLETHEITPDFIKNKYAHIKDTEKFDFEWDGRQPPSSKYAVKNVILIRHGQYDTSGETDLEQELTNQGREQTRLAGERLSSLLSLTKKDWAEKLEKKLEKLESDEKPEEIVSRYTFPEVNVIKSTMTRARNTAEEVESELKKAGLDFKVVAESDNIREHRPYPYMGRGVGKKNSFDGHWEDEENYAEASLRIENGFREFVHRADEGDVTESFDVICGHANVHRYFVFRALQSVS